MASAKRLERKIQRLRDRRNDYWDWLLHARPALRPSTIRKAEERLSKLNDRLAEMEDGA